MTIKHLFPSVWPTLNLDFANELALDPRITFSRSSIGTYVDATRTIRTAASDEPRFDHDPVTGASLGLLIEEERTNLVTDSASSNNWTVLTGGTAAASTSVCPDGSTTATRVTGAALNDGAYKSFTATASGIHLASYYARTRTGTATIVKAAISGTTGLSVTLPADGSWVRVIGVPSNVGAGGKYLAVRSASAAIDIDVWGLQAELGSFPTSYVPTAGTTVTRAADFANITGTNFSSWYNQGEGSFIVSADRVDGLPVSQFTVTTTNVRLPEFKFTTSGAGQIFNNIAGSYTSPTPLLKATFGASFDGTGMSRYINGSGDSVGNGGINDTNTAFYLGNYLNNATLYILTGHISRVSYYPRRLSDEQLKALTA